MGLLCSKNLRAAVPSLDGQIFLIIANQSDKAPLNPDLVGPEDPCFVSRVGRLERDRCAPATQSFKRCLVTLN